MVLRKVLLAATEMFYFDSDAIDYLIKTCYSIVHVYMNLHSQELNLDSLRSQFKIMKECPLCKKSFKMDRIQLVEMGQTTKLLHITCPSCKNALLILISFTDMGVGLVGLTSDLTLEDVRRLKTREAFGSDELLDYYEVIYNNQSEFVEILSVK